MRDHSNLSNHFVISAKRIHSEAFHSIFNLASLECLLKIEPCAMALTSNKKLPPSRGQNSDDMTDLTIHLNYSVSSLFSNRGTCKCFLGLFSFT